jgi:hypothetical protein
MRVAFSALFFLCLAVHPISAQSPPCTGNFLQAENNCERFHRFSYDEEWTIQPNEALWFKSCHVDNKMVGFIDTSGAVRKVLDLEWTPGRRTDVPTPDTPIEFSVAQPSSKDRVFKLFGYNGPAPGGGRPNPHDFKWIVYKKNNQDVTTFFHAFRSYCATNESWTGDDNPIFEFSFGMRKTP